MNDFGPAAPCRRTACVGGPAHPGGAHLDPSTEHYDGPDTALHALTYRCRPSTAELLHTARADGWNVRLVETALHHLMAEIGRLNREVAAVRVDADHKVTEAMKRSEDCKVHGATIRQESHAAYNFSVLAERTNAERVAWLSAVHHIREAVAKRDDPLAAAVIKFCDAAGRDADRARKRFNPPSMADCEKAGGCQHPFPEPHDACGQLRLDFDSMEVVA